MIEAIKLRNCASYETTEQTISPLLACNYFFGFNGSGKSTIARLLQQPSHPDFRCCAVTWSQNHPLEVLVYNREFVAEYFDDTDEIRGVFTLGKDSKEAKAQIAAKRAEAEKETASIARAEANLERANGELASLDADVAAQCWEAIGPRKSPYREAFAGHVGSVEAFKTELMRHRGSSASSRDAAYLEERAKLVFGPAPEHRELIPDLVYSELIECDADPLLSTRIIGSADVPIAQLIGELQNQDWIRQGQSYLGRSAGKCPFCQQQTPERLEQDLNRFFDETYLRQVEDYKLLVAKYRDAASAAERACLQVIEMEPISLDIVAFRVRLTALKSGVEANLERLEKKLDQPSRVVELRSLESTLKELRLAIGSANRKIREHNETVANLETERENLKNEIWKYIADVVLKSAFDKYVTDRQTKEREIIGLKDSIRQGTERRTAIEDEVKELESRVTDVRRVLNDVNRLLGSFGFRGFSLEATATGKGYRIIRGNGQPAKESLSEGERSFVTFLYFYHLIEGSLDETGATSDRVIVFDDPVSSMDSEILFIVSTLIRRVCDKAVEDKGHIKQVFVLTHNVYFHKEVSFKRERSSKDTFWVVRKPDGQTVIQAYGAHNPVKTSYQMLWDEIGLDDPSPLTVKNNIRRILEHYFTVHGNVAVKSLPDYFDDEDPDRLVCHSFVSMIQDGSHSIDDDIIFSSCDSSAVATYLRVLAAIFHKSGHINHYLMMCSPKMKAEYEAPVAP